jgi:hypothetical protein
MFHCTHQLVTCGKLKRILKNLPLSTKKEFLVFWYTHTQKYTPQKLHANNFHVLSVCIGVPSEWTEKTAPLLMSGCRHFVWRVMTAKVSAADTFFLKEIFIPYLASWL